MNKDRDRPPKARDVRGRAEAHLAESEAPGPASAMDGDGRLLIQELKIHQIELELQNEELRQARQDLEASLERYIDLYDFAPIGYLTLDSRGVVREVNLAAAALLGSVRSQVSGRAFAGFLAQKSTAELNDFLARIIADQAKQSCQITLAGPGPEPRHLHVEGAPAALPEAGGEQAGEQFIRLAMLDITDRLQVEAENLRLQTQLLRSQKMEAIGTLAGGIAHEFNNILTVIMGFSEIALEEAQNGEATPNELYKILKAAERARKLVKQILAFSRHAHNGKKPLHVATVVSEAIAMLEPTIPKMISMELTLNADLSMVHGDPSQIEQVLLNMASNAVDAMPTGGKLAISAENVFLDESAASQHEGALLGPYVMISVADNGQGMDQETMNRIFDPFFTTKDVGKGTGLGLASVYGIVKNHGGFIVCHSKPGGGATFQIYFPAPPTIVRGFYSEGSETNAVPGGTESILLVDDEPDLRDLGCRILRSMGYQVRVAANGEEALAVWGPDGSFVDAVIMDLSMPGMGGFEALKKMVAIDPKVKVIIASGYSADTQKSEVLAAGATAYITKPFQKAALIRAVREVLDR